MVIHHGCLLAKQVGTEVGTEEEQNSSKVEINEGLNNEHGSSRVKLLNVVLIGSKVAAQQEHWVKSFMFLVGSKVAAVLGQGERSSRQAQQGGIGEETSKAAGQCTGQSCRMIH